VNYEQIEDFIKNRMRMSHVYQPVMLKTILDHGGRSSTTEIARAILNRDESQIEYYEKIVGNMVGRVLRSHGIVKKDSNEYRLEADERLSAEQVTNLIHLCETKLAEYTEKRGELIWQHRKLSAGYISGSLKFEVLKRAQFHCELCGVSADVKALEVDHIVPRNRDGTDDLSNLQALCYSCNSMKRDRDDTNFREIRQSYEQSEEGCPFCRVSKDRVVHENELACSVRDAFPVTALHTLVIPKRHVVDIFDLSRPETNATNEILKAARSEIEEADENVAGFNIGVNSGEAAGQTIRHCHIHLIPRRRGDVLNPVGGIRNIIPGKGSY
jgi:diadenosine tetraphosphate (Ap4A) HIT family hydrolase/5-methylcytosine-specific restriction endonuclease McrA